VPDNVLFDFSGRTSTFLDVYERASAIARGLRQVGVRRGDTVVTMLDNSEDSVAAWYAANMLGAIWVGTNTALRGEFLRHVLDDSGAKIAICESELVDRYLAIEDRLDTLELLLVRNGEGVSSSSFKTDALDAHRLASSDNDWFEACSDDLAMLVYTGGTTGPSKGCAISNGYVLNLCRHFVASTGRKPEEVNWSPLPMYHFNIVAQTIMSSVTLRGTAAIAPRFSVSKFWPEIERTGARVVNLLGSMGALIALMPEVPEMKRCFGQIRFVSGAPFPPEIQQIWRDRYGIEEIGGGVYGMTEAVPLTVLKSGTPAPPASSGKRNEEDFEVRLFNDEDEEVGPGEIGEVVARPRRTNVMFQGYWRRPEATMAAMRNTWFHTGDLGMFDDEGFFYFKDRKQDYLRWRGENISSVELETAFNLHPDIEQVAVHAVPSQLGEDDVKVTAVRIVGSGLTALDLFNWAKERVPYFALPRYIEFRKSLPVSAVGRIHKYQLRDEGATADTWDRESDPDATWERR
jgi:crotonobetaine/carnitine-CoA ligase